MDRIVNSVLTVQLLLFMVLIQTCNVQTCKDHPCPPRWNYSDFQPCSNSCGIGIQTREVSCIHEVTRGGANIVTVPNNLCPQPPPPDRQYCNVLDCPIRWHTSEWTECSKSCGGGLKTRQVECKQVMAQNHVMARPAAKCPSGRPQDKKPCNTKSCVLESDRPFIPALNHTFVQTNPSKKKLSLKIGGQAVVFFGTQVRITCPVKRFNRTKIQWAKDHNYIANSEKYKISEKGALRIQSVTQRDSGVYACIAARSSAELVLSVKPRPGEFGTISSEEIHGLDRQHSANRLPDQTMLDHSYLANSGVFLVQSQCPLNYTCTTFGECSTHSPDIPTLRCSPGENKYCCPPPAEANDPFRIGEDPPIPQEPQESLFPNNCGREGIAGLMFQGKRADIGQFPWMALLAFKLNETSDEKSYLCGGTLINNRYILTAAHCVSDPRAGNPVSVRLGETVLNSEPDCKIKDSKEETQETPTEEECSDPPLDVDVEEVIPHERYSTPYLKNDIALIRLKEVVSYTKYIKPICLPFSLTLTGDEGREYFVAGWGKTDIGLEIKSSTLMLTSMRGISTSNCNELQPGDVQPLDGTQVCAGGGGNLGDVCKGDSGGPLMFSQMAGGYMFRTYQIGVVSFGTIICGDTSAPSVFTRVSSYRDWIHNIVKH